MKIKLFFSCVFVSLVLQGLSQGNDTTFSGKSKEGYQLSIRKSTDIVKVKLDRLNSCFNYYVSAEEILNGPVGLINKSCYYLGRNDFWEEGLLVIRLVGDSTQVSSFSLKLEYSLDQETFIPLDFDSSLIKVFDMDIAQVTVRITTVYKDIVSYDTISFNPNHTFLVLDFSNKPEKLDLKMKENKVIVSGDNHKKMVFIGN